MTTVRQGALYVLACVRWKLFRIMIDLIFFF